MTWTHAALLLLPLAVLAYWLAVPLKWRPAYMLALSMVLAGFFSVPYLLYFLLNITLVFFAAQAVRRRDERTRWILGAMLVWLVGNLCFFKYTNKLLGALLDVGTWWLQTPDVTLPKIALPLGISYITFRLIHYLVESYRNKCPQGSFAELGAYTLFFPTFLAGPVDRFPRVHPQMRAQPAEVLPEINQGLLRLGVGIVRKFVVADTLARYVLPVLNAPEDHGRWIVILAIYGLAIRIYMDFAGYTDMALGVSRLFGYRIMENFNKPFLQRNIAMFWRSWHISVYSWIRDYFFFPLFGYKASQAKIYLGIFTAMMVFMLWHDLTWNWFALGVYHGLGLIAWQAFQELKRARPALRKLMDRPYLTPLSIALTFTFVTFGFVIFSFDIGQVVRIMRRVF
jgi:alginate O-acetyltransferase complex protein AlgI